MCGFRKYVAAEIFVKYSNRDLEGKNCDMQLLLRNIPPVWLGCDVSDCKASHCFAKQTFHYCTFQLCFGYFSVA